MENDLKKAGKFGITAPMAALLLSVDSKRATADADLYLVDEQAAG